MPLSSGNLLCLLWTRPGPLRSTVLDRAKNSLTDVVDILGLCLNLVRKLWKGLFFCDALYEGK